MPSSTWDRLNKRIIGCDRCPRLREHCRQVAAGKRRSFEQCTYWGRPVPNFGDRTARLLIVGLAPAAHGANRTGRMFTGDRSGEWLYRALHKAGFGNQPEATDKDDGLALNDCAITAACHCAPPDNKPSREELAACGQWLSETCDVLPVRVFLALGQIAWRTMFDEARRRGWLAGPRAKFAHGATVALSGDRWIIGSYHPSQQNTFTGRLTEPMFDEIFSTVSRLLIQAPAVSKIRSR